MQTQVVDQLAGAVRGEKRRREAVKEHLLLSPTGSLPTPEGVGPQGTGLQSTGLHGTGGKGTGGQEMGAQGTGLQDRASVILMGGPSASPEACVQSEGALLRALLRVQRHLIGYEWAPFLLAGCFPKAWNAQGS